MPDVAFVIVYVATFGGGILRLKIVEGRKMQDGYVGLVMQYFGNMVRGQRWRHMDCRVAARLAITAG